MKTDKKYKLWTFQGIKVVEELKNTGILEAKWEDYWEEGSFTKAYRWMANQMSMRGINCTNAPIWAWHSCKKYEHAPRLIDARCLLSDVAIESGIQTIEFECPAELALLCSYGWWNVMLHDNFIPKKEDPDIDRKTETLLFETSRKKLRKYDDIQATLPYLKLEWVKDIRELNLKPNDSTFDREEKV
ncbi:DUF3841 domain-containing protein [Runella sp.]|jgi:hypothetical protein|uniref:DUF3841 domain-containing protein n=1 Tax=Runella sp. TaxID=1960881 RepID=UPI00261EDC44|nr:DUF3841 domain-containing protein [Runella sp.]